MTARIFCWPVVVQIIPAVWAFARIMRDIYNDGTRWIIDLPRLLLSRPSIYTICLLFSARDRPLVATLVFWLDGEFQVEREFFIVAISVRLSLFSRRWDMLMYWMRNIISIRWFGWPQSFPRKKKFFFHRWKFLYRHVSLFCFYEPHTHVVRHPSQAAGHFFSQSV